MKTIITITVCIMIMLITAIIIFTEPSTGKNIINETDCFQVNDVEVASKCLRDWVKTFYNYSDRNEKTYINNWGNLEDIKLNGGDCFDYSKLYENYFNKNGYLTKLISIYPKEKLKQGHTFLIVYDTNLTKYCKIDMLYIDCKELG